MRPSLSWSEDGTLGVWDLATSERRRLTGHDRTVTGALVLPDGRVLSWGEDRTLRWQAIKRPAAAMAFWFDATPIAVLQIVPDEVSVGDALRRVHFLELLNPLS